MNTSKYKILLGFASVVLSVYSCTQEDRLPNAPVDKGEKTQVASNNNDNYTTPNEVIVKVTREVADRINAAGGDMSKKGLRAFSNGLRSASTQTVKHLFLDDKRFEKRHREAGLDQWFVIKVGNNPNGTTRSFSEIRSEIKDLPEIEYMEPVYTTTLVDNGKPVYVNSLSDLRGSLDLRGLRADNSSREGLDTLEVVKTAYFNDKLLPGQWHYNNTGELAGSKRGADINLYEAWDQTTGTPNVIVDVVDGGIDPEHEDLKQNLWVNEAELKGKPGVDDDHNGVPDDIHGFNFVDNTGKLIGHLHGTHVAGTIAAVNNNKIGVCGVAGGNGDPKTGVRLMSSQIFAPSPFANGQDRGTADLPAAMVYGADNGAVISQNSWGFRDPNMKDTPEALKVAIDYFVNHAGLDSLGNQRSDSPMKGGVVIFAAGNDYVDKLDFPASYHNVIAVAAMAPNFRRAGYSTHGDWVDVSAPGGDSNMLPNIVRREYQVLSTFPGNKYGYLDGTSMACPHVSGVAALIVSKFGGPGFTNEDLKAKLLKGTNDIYLENPDKRGKLGVGLVDAGKALSEDMHQKPEPVKDLKVVGNVSRLTVEWSTVKDPDDGNAFWYYICAKKDKFTSVPNIDNPGPGVYIQKIRAPRAPRGRNASKYEKEYLAKYSKMQGKSAPLPIGESLNITVIAEDRWGNRSDLGNDIEGTVENGKPVIDMRDGLRPRRITGTETDSITFQYSDPDNDAMTVALEGDKAVTDAIQLKLSNNGIAKTIITTGKTINALAPGKYTAYLVVTDSHKGVTKQPFTFEVYKNHPPVVSAPIDYINLSFGSKKRVFLGRYFTDPDNHFISFKLLKDAKQDIALTSFNGTYIDVTGLKKGVTSIMVRVEDTQKGVLDKEIKIVVSNSKLLYNVTPMIAKDFLDVYLNEELTGVVRLTIYDAYGQKILKRVVNTENDKQIKLDLRGFAAGSYLLNVESTIGSEKITIIKK